MTSKLHVRFASNHGRTEVARVHEAGALRLRQPRNVGCCEGVILNTGGGILGGDHLSLAFDLAPNAEAVLTTVAAEKIYRSDDRSAVIETHVTLEEGARLDWLPQETILFNDARLHRRLTIDMPATATLLAAEMIVFGRLAMGEGAIRGGFRDSWRLRRDGDLVFADETRLEGQIGAILDRPALGNGARAAALILFAAPETETLVEPVRGAFEPFAAVAAGVSAYRGILVARLSARSPDQLRRAMIAGLSVLRSGALPRVWQ